MRADGRPATWASPEVELHQAPLAAELWAQWEALNGSYVCTRAFLEHFEAAGEARLAVVHREGAPRAAFLFTFTRGGRAARVLGRYTAPDPEDVAAFAAALFGRLAGLRRIELTLIDALPRGRALGRPAVVVRQAEELRVAFPPTWAEYERALGKDFMARARYHRRRLERERPQVRFATAERADIPRRWVAEVLRLHHARMAAKRARSPYDARYEEGIYRVARAHGAVTALLDGERVCAGLVHVRRGTRGYGWVIGHDEEYGRYRAGRLCQLEAFRHEHSRGLRIFHFLLGDAPYKRELGGLPAPLASYVVLRGWAALRPGDLVRWAGRQAAAAAGRSVRGADAALQGLLGRQGTPLTDLARALAERARRLIPR